VLRAWNGQSWTQQTAPYPVEEPPLLDRELGDVKRLDPTPWGMRPVLLPIAAYVVVIGLAFAASHLIDPHGRTARLAFSAVANIALDAVIATAAYVAGRDVARRAGGWGRAFGWRAPRWKDLAIALAAVGLAFGGRIAINTVVVAFGGAETLRKAQNLNVSHVDAAVVVLLVVVAGIAAPILEELVFRGLILRTFAQRIGFWPAAALSTAIFAVGHTYEAGSVGGAVVLALDVGLIGLVNCVLVRYTARLAPGIIAHSIVNLAAVAVLAAGVTST
jgi:membrane protease YdiL (CAAX protease family)